MEFQIINELTQSSYHAFSLLFTQITPEMPIDSIQRYFNAKIFCPPYKSAVAVSFFNLVAVNDLKVLREFTQMLDYEMSPHSYKFAWRLKFSWTMPNGYQIKNPNKANFGLFYQTSLHGFLKRDKYYFIVYLFNQQRVPGPHSPQSILLLVGFDPQSNGIAIEVLRPINDNNPVYNAYEVYMGSFVNAVKQKGLKLTKK
jgi:hypothetical protein